MATMTASLERTDRVWDDILDLESSNRSGSPGGRPKATTTDSMKNTTLLHRGDTTEIPMKGEEVRPHKPNQRSWVFPYDTGSVSFCGTKL